MTVKRGALIVIEGIDRTGKSTQSKRLGKTNLDTVIKTFII